MEEHSMFEMDSEPNPAWGKDKQNRPKSLISDHLIVPVPYVLAERKTFKDSLKISLGAPGSEVVVYYSLDGKNPDSESLKYTAPFYFKQSAKLKAIALKNDDHKSKIIESEFIKIPEGRKIAITYPYDNQYTAGGNDALIDFVRGGSDFRNGTWQGYQKDFEAIVDFGKEENISSISLGTIQSTGSWIFTPKYVEFSVSTDGKNFIPKGKIMSDIPDNKEGSVVKEFSLQHQRLKTRYIKVFAKNYGLAPELAFGCRWPGMDFCRRNKYQCTVS